MNTAEKDAITAIQKKFPVKVVPVDNRLFLEFEGVPERFILAWANQEFTISTSAWHEHFGDLDQLLDFLDSLFSGRIQIVVKYRGETPVRHQIQVLKDGKVNVISQTGALLPLFWRLKSLETLRYVIPNNAAQPSSADNCRGK